MRVTRRVEALAWVLLAYVPFLLSSPGRVSADSKQYLYLDPGGFLGRAGDLWDPTVGAGGVPHQHLGYLFPVGPYFWALDALGVPDWVAQRLWLGTLSLIAALGARYLLRTVGLGRAAAIAGALVYAASPYQLAFTARMSVLLLPWAALPWLVALTMRATRTRGWRAPTLIAVVLLLAGGINASSLLLVGLGPLLWVLLELGSPGRRVAALRAVGRVGILALGVSLWWLLGVRVQGGYGLPVLQLTENLQTVAEASLPGDVLRGLGNWFFYGRDRLGYSLDQAQSYAENDLIVVLTYGLPVVALAGAFLLRWTHRAYFALLVVVGVVVSVGSWPYDDATPYGRAWRAFTEDSSFGLAFRNSPRAVPLVVLGLAGLLAAAVDALPRPRWRDAGVASVAVLALAGLLPVMADGYLTEFLTRPEELPEHWAQAGDALDAGDHGTRILEIPGSSFASYEWGTTVDPVTPGLTDRPYVAREVLPYGTPVSVNLVAALDRRIQLGVLEPDALVPLARLLGVGTVSLRADLDRSGRFDTTEVEPLWAALSGARPTGLDAPIELGPPGGRGDDPDLPSVALFDLADPQPIVRTHDTDAPLVVAGDGDGLVDAAAAGLLDGDPLVRYAADLGDDDLDAALDAGARLVVTDSNRRRIETWFYSIRDTRGPTERAGDDAPDPTGYDFRLDPFDGATDADRTVVEQLGGTVDATSEGGPDRPEDRAAAAVDGDPATAWRVGGADPRGQTLTVTPDRPVTVDALLLRQPDGPRTISRARVWVGDEAFEVALGPASTGPGQRLALEGHRAVERVRVEIVETQPPSPSPQELTPVGIAELGLGDLQVDEVVRLPVDLLDRTGARLDGHPLAVVLSRLRLDLPTTDRRDEERRIDRRLELPVARTFAVEGVARDVDGGPASTMACRDDLLTVDGTPVPVRVGSVAADGGRPLESCSPVPLAAGSHRVTATAGAETDLDIDRLVLSSGSDGTPSPFPSAPPADPSPDVRIDDSDHVEVTVETDGSPFWLVLGQSASPGWSATPTGASLGDRVTVDGFANGWLVTPDEAGSVTVALRWDPQRVIRWGLLLSGLAVVAVVFLLAATWGRRPVARPALAAEPRLVGAAQVPALGLAPSALAAAGVGVVTAVVAPPDVAVAAAAAILVAGLVPVARWALVLLAPAALALSRLGARPSLAWLAVALLAGEVALGQVEAIRTRRRAR